MRIMARLRALPTAVRADLYRSFGWFVLAAALDGICGVLLVPLVQAWFRADSGEIGYWTYWLVGLTVCQAVVAYMALRKGYLVGGSITCGVVESLVRRLPRVASWHTMKTVNPEGLLRGPVMQAMGLPAHLLGPLIRALVTPIVMSLVLIAFDVRLAVYLIFAGILLAVLLRWSGWYMSLVEKDLTAVDLTLATHFQVFAAQQTLLRGAGHSSQARLALDQALYKRNAQAHQRLRRSLPVELAFASIVQAAFIGLLVGGVAAASAGWVEIPVLIALLVLFVRFIEPLAQLIHLDQALRLTWQALDTVLCTLKMPLLETPSTSSLPHDGSLRAYEVGYTVHSGVMLIKNVTLDIAPYGVTAIVGPSGSGKSTLLALLGRIMDPTVGQVQLGGVDARALSEVTLANHRNMLFQDNRLLCGSLAWNLCMGNVEASDAEVWAALAAVGLEKEVRAMPEGLQTQVGSMGQLLSGGQRQRVCVARSLLSRAAILLWDEPTSQLDAISAEQVCHSLLTRRGCQTIVVATHRPELAQAADWIVVLDTGEIRGQGPHSVLLQTNTWYRNFACASNR